MRRRERITLLGAAGRKRSLKLVAAAILWFAGVQAKAAEIHDGDTGYIANDSLWFTDESDLSVCWRRGSASPLPMQFGGQFARQQS